MKSSIDQLSPKERETLANWYETESYRVLRKLIDIERLELAKDHVDQTELSQIRFLSGQVQGLKKLIGTVARNFENSENNKKKTQQANKR